VLARVVQNESKSIALAKLFLGCFIVRGVQLSIVQRLDSPFVVQVHASLLTWIGKRLAFYEANKNKRALKTAALFFKVLMPLLGFIDGKDALRMSGNIFFAPF
jgi:cohesin complex subunit SA-1/2